MVVFYWHQLAQHYYTAFGIEALGSPRLLLLCPVGPATQYYEDGWDLLPMPTGHFRRALSQEGAHHRGPSGEEMRIHRRTPSSLYGCIFPVRVQFIPVLTRCLSQPNLTWRCKFLLAILTICFRRSNSTQKEQII